MIDEDIRTPLDVLEAYGESEYMKGWLVNVRGVLAVQGLKGLERFPSPVRHGTDPFVFGVLWALEYVHAATMRARTVPTPEGVDVQICMEAPEEVGAYYERVRRVANGEAP